jgi:ornithine carrier protein
MVQIAGIAGKFIEYPFDTVKVRLQSQPDNQPLRYKGPLDCFQQSIRQDGVIRGLYRGISAPLVGAALETSSLFVWEQVAQKAFFESGLYPREQPLPLHALWLTGAISGAFTSLVLTPIELVKCKMQVPAFASSDGMIRSPQTTRAIVRQIFQHHGFLGFWHGQMGTLIRETGGCAAWFGSKETATSLFRKYNHSSSRADTVTIHHPAHPSTLDLTPLPYWQQAVSGAVAGVTYNFLFFPADTIKSRMQTMAVNDARPSRSFWKEGAMLWREHGMKGMYRGCGITCIRSAPSSAFIFMIYDSLKANFHFS